MPEINENKNMDWNAYEKRIVVAVTGLSPQIVTETIYALVKDQQFIPTELVILTTAEGAGRIKLELLTKEPGWLWKLCRDLDIPNIACPETNIIVISNKDGKPLTDIQSADDNKRAADCIMDTVRLLTAHDNTALHVSIAGGRKTMGFYLGYALSMYGRSQDRLSHVLVFPGDFESNRNFFYPTQEPKVIHNRDEKPLNCQDAEIILADIPFVSLRNLFPPNLQNESASYGEVVENARFSLRPPHLLYRKQQQAIFIQGKRIDFTNRELAFYLIFIYAKQEGKEIRMRTKHIEEKEDIKTFDRLFREQLKLLDPNVESNFTADGQFQPLKTHVHDKIIAALGEQIATQYYIINAKRGKGRYKLSDALSEDVIEVKNF